MRFQRAYVEITNMCNRNCSFCPGTTRAPGWMEPEACRRMAEKLRPYTDYLCLHIMGEPLLHPRLALLLEIAGELGYLDTSHFINIFKRFEGTTPMIYRQHKYR